MLYFSYYMKIDRTIGYIRKIKCDALLVLIILHNNFLYFQFCSRTFPLAVIYFFVLLIFYAAGSFFTSSLFFRLSIFIIHIRQFKKENLKKMMSRQNVFLSFSPFGQMSIFCIVFYIVAVIKG